MMVTSSLSCGEFYILYIDPPCGHYAGDVTIMTIYCIVNRSYILNIGPLFCVLGCDIVLAGSGYITSSDTN